MTIRQFSTTFPDTENPISQGSIWTNGGAVGIDRTNVRTTTGKAFGTEPGNSGSIYDDSVATIQTGSWGNDQASECTVFIVPTAPAPNAECELLLRTTISSNSQVGYEFNVSASTGINYATIVRLEGTIGTFTTLAQRLDLHLVDGDIMGFKVVGSSFSAYLNGSLILGPVSDTTYPSGSPGIGFFLKNQTGNNDHYGITRFSTNDAGILPSLLITTGLTAGRAS